MPRKLEPGLMPKISVSVALRSEVLQALDENIGVIKAKLGTSFDWPDEKERDKVLRVLSRSFVIAELCNYLGTKDGAQMFYMSMKEGMKLMGMTENNQSDLFN